MSRVRLNPPGVNIRINVHGGTLADEFLCESCQHATVMRGGSMKQVQIRCSAEEGRPIVVPFRVVKCNKYAEVDSTNLRKMRQDAYYIHKTAHGGVHVVTCAQFDDYQYMQKLEEADAKTLNRRSKAAALPQARSVGKARIQKQGQLLTWFDLFSAPLCPNCFLKIKLRGRDRV